MTKSHGGEGGSRGSVTICETIPVLNILELHEVRVLWRLRLTPGGDSYVTLREDSAKVGENLGCASDVNHNRNLSWVFGREASSFSKSGIQCVIKCRFFRQSQAPSSAADLSLSNATAACP